MRLFHHRKEPLRRALVVSLPLGGGLSLRSGLLRLRRWTRLACLACWHDVSPATAVRESSQCELVRRASRVELRALLTDPSGATSPRDYENECHQGRYRHFG